jgi:acetyltransferase
MARAAGKAIVAVKLGQTEGGREAAMAHTGSLAGALEVFDALAGELGVVRADTLDDAVEAAELLAHTGAPRGRRLGAITLSGAFRGLILDAAERSQLELPALAPATKQRLDSVLGVGSLVSNPIDGGFGVLTSADNYLASIEAMQADPNIDMLLLQEALPREPGSARAEKYIAMVEAHAAAGAGKPIAFVTRPTRRCASSRRSCGRRRALRSQTAPRWIGGRRRSRRRRSQRCEDAQPRKRRLSMKSNPRRCCAPMESWRRPKGW